MRKARRGIEIIFSLFKSPTIIGRMNSALQSAFVFSSSASFAPLRENGFYEFDIYGLSEIGQVSASR